MSGRFSGLRRSSITSQSSDQTSSQTDSSTQPRSVPHVTRNVSSASLASSSQRPPARSFVTKASIPRASSPARYSSQGVRAQTAELASWALTDPKSLSIDGGPDRRASAPVIAQSRAIDSKSSASNIPLAAERWGTPGSLVQEAIEEESEPTSPREDEETPRAVQNSALSKLFHGQSHDKHFPTERFSEDRTPYSYGIHTPSSDAGQAEGGVSETTPLLKINDADDDARMKPNGVQDDLERQLTGSRKKNQLQMLLSEARRRTRYTVYVLSNPKRWSGKAVLEKGIIQPVKLLPCVFLGVLLNLLDALSYGMILFPLGEPIFADTGPDGISIFYISCIVSQLVYSCGGSIFKGAVGSEMIEVVPFFHKMAYTILARVGRSQPKVVLATTITAYAMSSVITGIVFFILGAFKLGSLVSFFPRHILIGCIGGVGFFLFVTGIEVSARLDGNLKYDIDTAKKLFSADTVLLWIIPLILSVVLLVVKRFSSSPLVVPAFFISVAAVFYIIAVAVPQFSLNGLRDQGWIFEQVEAGLPWYNFYSYYDFNIVDWNALGKTVPAMFALTFFGILHVPINVPALGIAAEEDDLNLNRELIAHGVSNAVSGFIGSIQNYLVYVNSELFIQNGGNSRLAGLLLAAATFGVLVAGPAMIGYVPIMVVGALIYYLGIALLEEALYDTWGKMGKLEYLTVLAIVLIMGMYDFVGGILAGIILACLNYVVQTSRKSAIRATYSGEIVESTVRRHPIQRHFLHEVGYQIYVTKLAGFLFFGSIVQVEKQSRALIEEEAFRKEPIRYLVFDLHHVNGIDYSAAEAFMRMERILGRREVRLVMSGVQKDNDVGKSLRSVGLWQDDSSVEYFENLNEALEYCENELLKAYYRHREAFEGAQNRQGSLDVPKAEPGLRANAPDGGFSPNSPRQRFLQQAATTTLDTERTTMPKKWQSFKQPLPLILQIFQDLTSENEDFWFRAVPYFSRIEYPAGTTLFHRGDTPRAFYLLQTGILHAHYTLPVGTYHESIVAGTTCGELPFFSETARTATVSAEQDCVVWRLDGQAWKEMQEKWPEGAKEVLSVALKLTKERVDAVTSYVLTTAG